VLYEFVLLGTVHHHSNTVVLIGKGVQQNKKTEKTENIMGISDACHPKPKQLLES